MSQKYYDGYDDDGEFPELQKPYREPLPIKEVAGSDTFKGIGSGLQQMLVIPTAAMAVASSIESPIEKILGAHLVAYLGYWVGRELVVCKKEEAAAFGPDHILLMPQYVWNNYRIDYALAIPEVDGSLIFVECDGAEFHSSDEQVARDRRKDREAKAAGIPVLRFTGTQIHREAVECAVAVARQMRRRLGRSEVAECPAFAQ